MTETSGRGSKWLKYSCLGCLGLIGLTVACSAGVTGLAWLQARSQKFEEQSFTRDLPASADSVDTETTGEQPPGSIERELEATPGKVVLELVGGEFEIKTAGVGEPLSVEAELDSGSHVLEESFEDGDDGWVYLLRFRAKGSGLISSLARVFGGSEPKVTIHLPQGVPFELDLNVREGGGWAELGGLSLTAADIELDKGGIQLDISSPLPAPMERLSVRGSMGGGEFRGLGNASPRELDFKFTMGGADVDLRGAWSVDSRIRIDSSMGGTNVWLPDDVHIVGIDGIFGTADSSEIPRPTLRFEVDTSMSGVNFID